MTTLSTSTSGDVSMPKRPVSDVLSETFTSFDPRTKIVGPFEDEQKRDTEFLEKLNSMLLELVLEFHAWSAARPPHESNTTADSLEKEVKVLLEREKEQEKTRQRLHEFITRIKLALAALTGLAH